MLSVTFTNPADNSGRDPGFKVQPSRIKVPTRELRDAFAAYFEWIRLFSSHIPKDSPRYAEFLRVSQLHADVEQAWLKGRNVDLEDGGDVWHLCSDLMFARRFVSVGCPVCAKEYSPPDCAVKDWSVGRGLAAAGGRRVVCPEGHTRMALELS